MAAGVPVILPANIPIVKEEGIFNSKNSIFMKDSSIESIVSVLSLLSEERTDEKDIASSIAHLSWKNIARTYSDLYHRFL